MSASARLVSPQVVEAAERDEIAGHVGQRVAKPGADGTALFAGRPLAEVSQVP